MHIAVVGTYPPTRCGIATFTADVEASLRHHGVEVTVVEVSPSPAPTGGPRIERDHFDTYIEAARQINELGCDVVLIEHEFGIFGGEAGRHLLALTETLTRPYVITLHTVLPNFSRSEAAVLQSLCSRAAAVTVFTSTARRLVLEQELVPARSIRIVPHGAPVDLYESVDVAKARQRLGLPAGSPVMTTFGLLSEGKGIALAIRALAHLAPEIPDLRYVVAGRTHPEVVRRDGERYRAELQALADELGVADRVIWVDRFMDIGELAGVLATSDVVCTPYIGENQIVSGVLTFALAAGCPVVSTPYRYARDLLADGAGLLCDFGDVAAFATAIRTLITDGPERQLARDAARAASASMAWPAVGATMCSVLAAAARTPSTTPTLATVHELLPDRTPATSHLRLLCDDTAIMQHSEQHVPRHADGYCVDDAGRMLPIAATLAETTGDDHWHVVTGRLLSYLRSAAVDGQGAMRNFMSWDRRWLDEPHHGDHVGRAVWGLGELASTRSRFADDALHQLQALAPGLTGELPTRTIAYAALGLAALDNSTTPAIRAALQRLAATMRHWVPATNPDWVWFEPRLTYDNARIPEAMFLVGHRLDDRNLVEAGASLLQWLDKLCRRGDHYRFPGHLGLVDRQDLIWSGDEQPLEATAMADAHRAWWLLSGDESSVEAVERAWSWFRGNNRLRTPVGDLVTGAGFDGLGAAGVNLNCGAESTVAFVRCALTRRAVGATSAWVARPNGVVQRVHA